MTYKKLSEARPEVGQLCLVQSFVDQYPSIFRFAEEDGGNIWIDEDCDVYTDIDDDYWMRCPVRSE